MRARERERDSEMMKASCFVFSRRLSRYMENDSRQHMASGCQRNEFGFGPYKAEHIHIDCVKSLSRQISRVRVSNSSSALTSRKVTTQLPSLHSFEMSGDSLTDETGLAMAEALQSNAYRSRGHWAQVGEDASDAREEDGVEEAGGEKCLKSLIHFCRSGERVVRPV